MKKLWRGLRIVLPLLILLLIIAAGVYFRVHQLGWWGLTYDECLTEERSHWSLWHLFRFYITSRAPVNALIYFCNARLFGLLGYATLSEWQIRLPSVIFSCLSIPFLYLLGKRLKDYGSGLLLAALGAFSLLLILHGREARYYSFICFFSTFLYYEVLTILDFPAGDKRALRHYALYALCAIFGLGSHQGFYILFAFSNVFLFFLALWPCLLTLCHKEERSDFPKVFNNFFTALCLLVLPCLIYCYPFLLTTGADKPATPTGAGALHLLPELNYSVMADVSTQLWRGAPFAEIALPIFLVSIIILLFTARRLFALYALFIKLSTFVLLRIATQRLTYEEFRVKYVIFLLLLDMLVMSGALAYLGAWLWKLPGWFFRKKANFRENFERLGYGLFILILLWRLFSSGEEALMKAGLFEERLEGVRYVFDYLKDNYQPGDIVLFQAEPNSWIHKNCYYEQRLRPYAASWIVKDGMELPSLKKQINTKDGSYIWWIMIYRPTRNFLPYFYHDLRAFGPDPDKRFAMVGCRSAEKVKTLADALYLTANLYHATKLINHPQFEDHLIKDGLLNQDYSRAVFSNLISQTLARAESPKSVVPADFFNILSDPKLEIYAYRVINEWWAGMTKTPREPMPRLTSELEIAVYDYLSACQKKDAKLEAKVRDELLTFPHGFWIYDRIYRFTFQDFERPYLPPADLRKYLSYEEIFAIRERLEMAYFVLNPSMAEEWKKVMAETEKNLTQKEE